MFPDRLFRALDFGFHTFVLYSNKRPRSGIGGSRTGASWRTVIWSRAHRRYSAEPCWVCVWISTASETPGTAVVLPTAFLADPFDGFHLVVLIDFLNLFQLAKWNVRGVIGLGNTSLKKLRLENLECVGW